MPSPLTCMASLRPIGQRSTLVVAVLLVVVSISVILGYRAQGEHSSSDPTDDRPGPIQAFGA